MKVELLKCMDTELDIVNITRTSTDKWFEEWDAKRDEPLIETIVFEQHWTSMGQIQVRFRFDMALPIARQFLRSQVGQTFNELSRRYIGMQEPPVMDWPAEWRGKPPKRMKQGSSGPMPQEYQDTANSLAGEMEDFATEIYRRLLEEGYAPEQARYFLPQGTMTRFIQTGSLFYYARVCGLRRDPHAQKEVRDVAVEIDNHMKVLFPYTWKCLMFYADELSIFQQQVKAKWRTLKESGQLPD